jgi:hypothetical protein
MAFARRGAIETGLIVAMASGAKNVPPVPSDDEVVAMINEQLNAPLPRQPRNGVADRALRRALGLRNAR